MENQVPDQSPEKNTFFHTIERQMERSSFYTHTALSDHSARINEIEAFLYGIMDVLLAKGLIVPEELSKAVENVRTELEEKQETASAGVAIRMDGAQTNTDDFIPVNCEERMPVCKAICCKLDFALSTEEIEAGQVKWDLGRPYFIRHETHGYCTHNDLTTGHCKVYHNRPGVCKKYSCAKDERIWKDFENMELNHEWISLHLIESRPALNQVVMHKEY